MKRLVLILLLLTAPLTYAQEEYYGPLHKGSWIFNGFLEAGTKEGFSLAPTARCTYALLDNFVAEGAISVENQYPAAMDNGILIPKGSLSFRATIPLKEGAEDKYGMIPLEQRLFVRHFGAYNLREWNLQTLTGWCNKHFTLNVGFQHRIVSDLNAMVFDPSEPYVVEPFNLVYLARYTHTWNNSTLSFRITNTDLFFSDYFLNPCLGLGYDLRLKENMSVWGDLYYHPTSIFNLTATNYELMLRLGLTISTLKQ